MKNILDTTTDAHILIVDDKQENVSLLEMMLSYAGYTNVHSTTDSREVEKFYQDHNIDLLLLDIRMPHMDGFQVMEQLSKTIKDDYLPILVLTAQNDMETRLKALEAGARDFVIKPFEPAEVLNRIRNMLEVRLLYNERIQQNQILEARVQERTLELQERNEDLKRTHLEIIRCLGRAGEFRDNETGMHVLRMSHSCQRLALAAGLDESHAELIMQASPMHDVGKIGIPDAILLKPGKLDEDEFEIMKGHADIGSDILGNHASPLLKLAEVIASCHHEKWDGSGYPKGLKGEEIPIEARIASICDVFDALTSERPYKKAWSIEKSIALIDEQSGKHFDPKLASLFNEVLPDILAIRQNYVDDV